MLLVSITKLQPHNRAFWRYYCLTLELSKHSKKEKLWSLRDQVLETVQSTEAISAPCSDSSTAVMWSNTSSNREGIQAII